MNTSINLSLNKVITDYAKEKIHFSAPLFHILYYVEDMKLEGRNGKKTEVDESFLLSAR